MTRGGAIKSKVHFKGNTDDFIVFIDDVDTYKKWQSDKSIPLAHFVGPIKVFVTHKQGAQGAYDAAAKTSLSAEFVKEGDKQPKDNELEDMAINIILSEGSLQTIEMPERQGDRNDSMSSGRTK